MPQFLNSANFLFRSSTRLVRYYFKIFYVLLYICFLSLVELKRWLADVTFFPSSTPMVAFQHSGHFQARFFTRPFLARPEGSGVQTTPISVFFITLHSGKTGGGEGLGTRLVMGWLGVILWGNAHLTDAHTHAHTHTHTHTHVHTHTHTHTVSFVAWAAHCSNLVFLRVSQPYLPRGTHRLGENNIPTRKEPGYDSLVWLAM